MSENPVIKELWYEKGWGPLGHWSKIGEHRRRSDDKIYSSPRIILSSEFDRYIGRHYVPFHAKIEMNIFSFMREPQTFDCIILVLDKA